MARGDVPRYSTCRTPGYGSRAAAPAGFSGGSAAALHGAQQTAPKITAAPQAMLFIATSKSDDGPADSLAGPVVVGNHSNCADPDVVVSVRGQVPVAAARTHVLGQVVARAAPDDPHSVVLNLQELVGGVPARGGGRRRGGNEGVLAPLGGVA